MKTKSAYIIAHNGLGDNISMIGGINFLLDYYEHIYFICKDIYEENVKLFFVGKPVITVPFNHNDEVPSCMNIINNVYNIDNIDILICGYFNDFFKSKITNLDILNYKNIDSLYTIQWAHIRKFYYDIGLDLKIYYEFFDISSSNKSLYYVSLLKDYKIIFVHSEASNLKLNLQFINDKYINMDNTIIICANENMYPNNHKYYDLANIFVKIKIAYYIDIIKQAIEIYVVDSCFSCIIHPLNITKRLKATTVEIYSR